MWPGGCAVDRVGPIDAARPAPGDSSVAGADWSRLAASSSGRYLIFASPCGGATDGMDLTSSGAIFVPRVGTWPSAVFR